MSMSLHFLPRRNQKILLEPSMLIGQDISQSKRLEISCIRTNGLINSDVTERLPGVARIFGY